MIWDCSACGASRDKASVGRAFGLTHDRCQDVKVELTVGLITEFCFADTLGQHRLLSWMERRGDLHAWLQVPGHQVVSVLVQDGDIGDLSVHGKTVDNL